MIKAKNLTLTLFEFHQLSHPHPFSGPGSNSGFHIAFNCHVSSFYSTLRHMLHALDTWTALTTYRAKGLSVVWCSVMFKSGCAFCSRSSTELLFLFNTQYQKERAVSSSWLAMVTFITWLRWYPSGFSTVKSLFFSCGERIWNLANILFLILISASIGDSCPQQLLWYLPNIRFLFSPSLLRVLIEMLP